MIRWLPSGDSAIASGRSPTVMCRPAGAIFQPLGNKRHALAQAARPDGRGGAALRDRPDGGDDDDETHERDGEK